MTPPTNLRDQLIRDEGLRLLPYTDTVGKLTIGVGRNLTDVGISETEAEMLLENDVGRTVGKLLVVCPWISKLDAPRHAVLVGMAFNMGVTGLLGFRQMLLAVQAGQWATAAHEMLESRWAEQVGARAQRLAQQMETGVWT